MRGSTFIALTLLGAGGCLSTQDGRVPGERLGRFYVEAELVANDCGEGAFDAPGRVSFQIELSREPGVLYWLNGAAPIEGTLDADGRSFTLHASGDHELEAPGPRTPGCRLRRDDTAQGRLDAAVEPSGFELELRYHYQELEGSDCSALLELPGAPARLPCEQRYRGTGARQPN